MYDYYNIIHVDVDVKYVKGRLWLAPARAAQGTPTAVLSL